MPKLFVQSVSTIHVSVKELIVAITHFITKILKLAEANVDMPAVVTWKSIPSNTNYPPPSMPRLYLR